MALVFEQRFTIVLELVGLFNCWCLPKEPCVWGACRDKTGLQRSAPENPKTLMRIPETRMQLIRVLMFCWIEILAFFPLQSWLCNFKNAIWTHYVLCVQHVCYFAETSKNQISITCLESFSYRFLTTFCRGPDLLRISQNTSQNEVPGHPRSQKIKKT